jgi:cell division protein ZapA
MPRVDIMLNGRSYPIACEEGQEDRVREIAVFLDQRIHEVKRQAPTATDAQLLVMVSLMVTDELFDASAQGPAQDGQDSEQAAQSVGRLAGRIEALAARLEQA